MQTRRTLFVGVASSAALAVGGLGYRAWDRGVWSGGQGEAYSAWSDWPGNAGDGIKRPLRAAILASNPHDTQPWLFEIGQNTITVFADRARNLGTFDPFRREMHLGLGAAIENLVLAAGAFGFAAKVVSTEGTLALSPDNTPARVADIALTPMPAVGDALFYAIAHRRTNRGPYRADQSVAVETVRRLADLVTNEADILRDRVKWLILETHEMYVGAAPVAKMLSDLRYLGFEVVEEQQGTVLALRNKGFDNPL